MPLVPAKCTACGAELSIDSLAEAAVCSFCNTPFIVEKAINNYNSYNHYVVQNADIYLHDDRSIENRINNANVFFSKLNDAQKALDIFLSVSNDAPGDYRSWWGMVRIYTNEFKNYYIGIPTFKRVNEYVWKAINVASPEISKELSATWKDYKSKVEAASKIKIKEVSDAEAEKTTLIYRRNYLYESMTRIQNELTVHQRTLQHKKTSTMKNMIIWGVICAVFSPAAFSLLLSPKNISGSKNDMLIEAFFFVVALVSAVIFLCCLIYSASSIKKRSAYIDLLNKSLDSFSHESINVVSLIKEKEDQINRARPMITYQID